MIAPSLPFEFPTSLQTATPAEGQALAHQLATFVLREGSPTRATMAEMLRRPDDAPPIALVAAIYFHAISIANRGWRS